MVRLIIDGTDAVIDSNTRFPFTFKFGDLTDPAAVKNSFTKTVSLPACPENDRLFGHIWKLDQIATGFDPSVRAPFVLEVNGDVFETGYIKLGEVAYANGRPHSYSLNLFGGLGSFFYTLSEKDMTELEYPEGLTHTINKDTVFDLPAEVAPYMAYMLAYNGKYSGFKSDKYDNNSADGGDVGDILGAYFAGKEVDEHQMNEYRSYYQRPAMKMNEMIQRIIAQSGFAVALAPLFFSACNPYWEDSYVSLPQYTHDSDELKLINGEYQGSGALLPDYTSNEMYLAGTIPMEDISGDVTLGTALSQTNDGTVIDVTNQVLHLAALGGTPRVGLMLKLGMVATAKSTVMQVGGYRFSTNSQNKGHMIFTLGLADSPAGDNFQPLDNGTIVIGDYNFTASPLSPVFLFQQGAPAGTRSRAVFQYPPSGEDAYILNIPGEMIYTIVEKADKYIVVKCRYEGIGGNNQPFLFHQVFQNTNIGVSIDVAIGVSTVIVGTDTSLRSRNTSNYATMMPTGTSQFKMLLNYCQAFGLVFDRDRVTNAITVMTRNEYFADYKILDWTQKIDHSRGATLTPLNFDHRYGLLRWAESPTHYCETYKEKYTVDYGSLKLDTGYSFDLSEKGWLPNNIFQNAVMSMEYDYAFAGRNPNYANRDNAILPALFELNDGVRDASNSQLALFFRDADQAVPIVVSDDTDAMVAANEYMWTSPDVTYPDATPPRVTRPTSPAFTRLLAAGCDGNPCSLDFAKPRIAYYPEEDVNYPESATVYARFWQKWITERLSKDTRVWRPYVYLTASEVSQFRHNQFVRVDNTLWFVNEIADFDPTINRSVRVTLVRVNDLDAYLNGQTV